MKCQNPKTMQPCHTHGQNPSIVGCSQRNQLYFYQCCEDSINPPCSVKVYNGQESQGQYVSGIAVNGQKITVSKEMLPTAGLNMHYRVINITSKVNIKPDGTITFILPEEPLSGTLSLFANGLLLNPGVDYERNYEQQNELAMNNRLGVENTVSIWDLDYQIDIISAEIPANSVFIATYFVYDGMRQMWKCMDAVNEMRSQVITDDGGNFQALRNAFDWLLYSNLWNGMIYRGSNKPQVNEDSGTITLTFQDYYTQIGANSGESLTYSGAPVMGMFNLYCNGLLLVPDVDYVINIDGQVTVLKEGIDSSSVFLATYFAQGNMITQ